MAPVDPLWILDRTPYDVQARTPVGTERDTAKL